MYVCAGNKQSLRRNQRIQILLISKWKKEHLTIASDCSQSDLSWLFKYKHLKVDWRREKNLKQPATTKWKKFIS